MHELGTNLFKVPWSSWSTSSTHNMWGFIDFGRHGFWRA